MVFVQRRVSNDNVIPLDGVDYEVPRGHAGARIMIHRRLLDGTLATLHDGRLVDLAPVNLADNATSHRGRPGPKPEDYAHPLPPSAAELAWRQDLGSVLDPDGGFSDKPSDDNNEE